MDLEQIKTSSHESEDKKEKIAEQEKPDQVLSEQEAISEKLELEEAEMESRQNDLKKIKALEKAAGFNLDRTEEEIAENIEKERSEHIKKEIEQLKNDFIEHIKSDEYLQKLIVEFGGDKKMGKVIQRERLANIMSVKIEALPEAEVKECRVAYLVSKYLPRDIAISVDSENQEEFQKAKDEAMQERQVKIDELKNQVEGSELYGFYDEKGHKIFIAQDKKGYLSSAWHELSHASNKLEYHMRGSDQVIDLMQKSFRAAGDPRDEYFSHPEEMLARKKQLDRDLQMLGIKRYDEKTTNEHVGKIFESFEKGLLSSGSMQLLERIKPEKLKKFLDEIAKNEDDDMDMAA